MSIITDNIGVAKSVTVDITDTPLDARTRCNSEADIPNIKNPYVGMQIYTVSDGKIWVVRSLNAAETSVLTYEELNLSGGMEFSDGFIVDGNTVTVDTEKIATIEYVNSVFGFSTKHATALTFTALEDSTICLTKSEECTIDFNNLYYRKVINGLWYKYTVGTEIALKTGELVQFWNAENTLSVGQNNHAYFEMTGKIAASGNIQSLLNYSDSCSEYCYYSLFEGCKSLITAPELPATTLAEQCYGSMFMGCTSLTIAPELPATTLATACYAQMFSGCTSLTTAPELPATTLVDGCYNSMFKSCMNLSSISVAFEGWGDILEGIPGFIDQGATLNWVKNVAKSGTFAKPAVLGERYGVHYIPVGWTVINK